MELFHTLVTYHNLHNAYNQYNMLIKQVMCTQF